MDDSTCEHLGFIPSRPFSTRRALLCFVSCGFFFTWLRLMTISSSPGAFAVWGALVPPFLNRAGPSLPTERPCAARGLAWVAGSVRLMACTSQSQASPWAPKLVLHFLRCEITVAPASAGRCEHRTECVSGCAPQRVCAPTASAFA